MSKENDEVRKFTVKMEKTGPMEFKTTFENANFPELFFDEPEHSGGQDKYPSATRILTASIMNCLSASLMFCLTKSRLNVVGMKTTGSVVVGRNEKGFLRVKNVEVEIEPLIEGDSDRKKLERCVDIFKNYCIVSMSVKDGIPIETKVKLPE